MSGGRTGLLAALPWASLFSVSAIPSFSAENVVEGMESAFMVALAHPIPAHCICWDGLSASEPMPGSRFFRLNTALRLKKLSDSRKGNGFHRLLILFYQKKSENP
jgi:hypothetical protein